MSQSASEFRLETSFRKRLYFLQVWLFYINSLYPSIV